MKSDKNLVQGVSDKPEEEHVWSGQDHPVCRRCGVSYSRKIEACLGKPEAEPKEIIECLCGHGNLDHTEDGCEVSGCGCAQFSQKHGKKPEAEPESNLRAELVEAQRVLKRHHDWHQDIGEVSLSRGASGKWDEIGTNLSVEYDDSDFSRETENCLASIETALASDPKGADSVELSNEVSALPVTPIRPHSFCNKDGTLKCIECGVGYADAHTDCNPVPVSSSAGVIEQWTVEMFDGHWYLKTNDGKIDTPFASYGSPRRIARAHNSSVAALRERIKELETVLRRLLPVN